jgi:hypothetical protein
MLPRVFALDSGDMPHASVDRRGPATAATAAAAVVALQALALVIAGVWLMVRAFGDGGQDRYRGSTEVLGGLAILVGIGVCYLARAVHRRNPGVRAPLLVLEIICLPIAVASWQGGRWYVGLPLAAVAVLVVVLLGRAGILSPDADSED